MLVFEIFSTGYKVDPPENCESSHEAHTNCESVKPVPETVKHARLKGGYTALRYKTKEEDMKLIYILITHQSTEWPKKEKVVPLAN